MTTTFRLEHDHDLGEGIDGVVAQGAARAGVAGPALVRITGDVDLLSGFEAPALLSRMSARRPCRVVLDASEVTFLDVAGLSVLLVLAARLSADGHHVCLRRPSAPVVRVLALTGTADVLPLDDDAQGSAGVHLPSLEQAALRRSLVFRDVERLVHDGTSWDDPSAGPPTSQATGSPDRGALDAGRPHPGGDHPGLHLPSQW